LGTPYTFMAGPAGPHLLTKYCNEQPITSHKSAETYRFTIGST